MSLKDSITAKKSGSYRNADEIYVLENGTWQWALAVFVHNGSTWERVWVSADFNISTVGSTIQDATTVTLTGSVNSLEHFENLSVSFEYRQIGDSNWSGTNATNLTPADGSTDYSETIQVPTDAQYEFRAFGETNQFFSKTGSIKTFTMNSTTSEILSSTFSPNGVNLGFFDTVDVSWTTENDTSDWSWEVVAISQSNFGVTDILASGSETFGTTSKSVTVGSGDTTDIDWANERFILEIRVDWNNGVSDNAASFAYN